MAWSTSNRRSRLPSDWSEIRVRIFQRDKYRCQWIDEEYLKGQMCGAVATDIDHIQRGDCHEDANLQALCRRHHSIKSASEGRQAQLAMQREIKKRFARPREQHPGRIDPEANQIDRHSSADPDKGIALRSRPWLR